jgi:hypothetical protein
MTPIDTSPEALRALARLLDMLELTPACYHAAFALEALATEKEDGRDTAYMLGAGIEAFKIHAGWTEIPLNMAEAVRKLVQERDEARTKLHSVEAMAVSHALTRHKIVALLEAAGFDPGTRPNHLMAMVEWVVRERDEALSRVASAVGPKQVDDIMREAKAAYVAGFENAIASLQEGLPYIREKCK